MSRQWLDAAGPFAVARLAVVPCVIGYFLLLPPSDHGFSGADWAFGLASATLFLFGARWPLPVTVSQALLILGAYQWADAGPISIKVLASLALLELLIRRGGRAGAVGAVVLTAAYVLVSPREPVVLAYQLVIAVGGTVVLGVYVRSLVERLRSERQRAGAAETDRERSVEVARAAERVAIARELHDLVGHHMSSLALRSGVARHAIPDVDPQIADVLDDIHQGATVALDDLRRLVQILRAQPVIDPTSSDGSSKDGGGGGGGAGSDGGGHLQDALRAAIDRYRRSGVVIDAEIALDGAAVDPVRRLAALRIVQEGLTNVAEHAGPGAQARVEVTAEDDGALRLLVDDRGGDRRGDRTDGSGGGVSGFGIIGMRERVALVGGRLDVGPTETGWRLAAVMPAPEPQPVLEPQP